MSENVILPTLLGRVEEQFGIHFDRFQDIFADNNHPKTREACLYLFTEVLPAFTILDNACGDGSFLLASLKVLVQVYANIMFRIIDEPALHDVVRTYLKSCGKDERWLLWKFDSFEAFSTDSKWKYYVKRQIITTNLYGVDIDKEAIENAKSRLWNSMVSELNDPAESIDPLPNNAYNLRCGNSLVGYVRLRRRKGLDEIIPVDRFNHYIEALQAIYAAVIGQLEPSVQARTIGNIITIRTILIQLFKGEQDPEKKRMLQVIISGLLETIHRRLSDSYFRNLIKHWSGKETLPESIYFGLTPFHWVAEFSDVLLKNGGFDIVLGNPPYITMKKQTKWQKGIYDLKYRTFHANGDVYYLFMERSFALLNPRGTFAYIVPRYFLKAPTAGTLRKFLAEQHLARIYDFGQSTVFQGVGIHTLILFAHPLKDQAGFTGTYSRESIERFQSNQLNPEQVIYSQADLRQENWLFLPPAEQAVFRLIYQGVAGQFSDFCVLSKGLQTGKDEVFVINEETRQRFQIEPGALVPFMKGSGVKRFFIQNDDQLFLLFSTSHEGDAVMRLPHCAAYLTKNRPMLENRTRVPEWYQWRLGDERITLQWKQPKIVTASRGSRNVFAIDRDGYYFSQDMTFIQPFSQHTQYLYYFWAVLNSTITRRLMHWQFKELAKDVYEIFPEQIQKIPVKLPDASTLERINTVMREIERLAPTTPVEDAFGEVDALIYQIYTGLALH